MAYALVLGTFSFLFAVIWGRPLIAYLRHHRVGKQIRFDGPSSHQVKTGTPTMGGLMIVIPVSFIILAAGLAELLAGTSFGQVLLDRLGVERVFFFGRSILVPLGVMLGFGLMGGLDDWAGVRGYRNGEGLLGRWKFVIQLVLATIAALVLHFGPPDLHSVAIPGVAEKIDIGFWWLPIAMFFIVGYSNAVNLTDGLDGLAGSIAALCFLCYGIIAYLQDQGWLLAFCFTMTGGILAFLWYNAYPADLFMGDVGSEALGATLAVVALMTGQWLLLPIIGGVFVAETLSVILQVAYFKFTRIRYGRGRRLFKMAPLHHHFELLGWSETQVMQRFWLVAILTAMLGVALALWGNPPPAV
jgi:phospho-N-acetylmuramoyl-pentapeptide-transferase